MGNVLDIICGPMSDDNKWYHCPHCKADFNFMDVLDGDAAEPVNTHDRVYKCKNCDQDFRMPE